jgi:hypothetical protein
VLAVRGRGGGQQTVALEVVDLECVQRGRGEERRRRRKRGDQGPEARIGANLPVHGVSG